MKKTRKMISAVVPSGMFPGIKLKGNEKYRKLYHYTSFDTFVKIWLTKKLKFGKTSDVNDIQEVINTYQVDNFAQAPVVLAYIDIRSSYKQISFTMDYDSYIKGCMSPMMWGLYGDKRKGVCIELDFEKISFPCHCFKDEVKYLPLLPKSTQLSKEITNIKEIRNFIKANKHSIFFIKQQSWKNENEFRVISDKDEFLDISNAISAVYLTSNNSLECRMTEALVGDNIPVMYLNYIGNKFSIPTVTNTRRHREQIEDAKNDPYNFFNNIEEQARQHYDSLKHDENAFLLKECYLIPNDTIK